jgi:GNAT superfamily N-acetyltransferase
MAHSGQLNEPADNRNRHFRLTIIGGRNWRTEAGAPHVNLATVIFRAATRDDLPAIIALLADDILGKARDFNVVDETYERAFAKIDADPRNILAVADDGGVVGCMQITYIPGLGRHGAERAQIEAVRIRSDRRGAGLGKQFMAWAINQARERGCVLVQLTTDKLRTDAHRFYVDLGFVSSHEGMKLAL